MNSFFEMAEEVQNVMTTIRTRPGKGAEVHGLLSNKSNLLSFAGLITVRSVHVWQPDRNLRDIKYIEHL